MSEITETPLVSVLVAAYNHSDFILACLNSIAEDTYPNLELLILDDGSTDDTFTITEGWLTEHSLRFVRSKVFRQQNSGVCSTLNRLIGESKGQFLVFVASDDQLISGGIHSRMQALEAHPEWLAIIGIATVMNSVGIDLAANAMTSLYKTDLRMFRHPKSMSVELILHWAVPGPVFMARREAYSPVIGVGLYDERLPVEDRDYYLRLLGRAALGYLDVPVGRYRIHATNASRPGQVSGRISDALLESCHKNLAHFNGFPRFCLAAQIACEEAYKAYREKPNVRSWVRRASRRLSIEIILRITRFFNYLGLHLRVFVDGH